MDHKLDRRSLHHPMFILSLSTNFFQTSNQGIALEHRSCLAMELFRWLILLMIEYENYN